MTGKRLNTVPADSTTRRCTRQEPKPEGKDKIPERLRSAAPIDTPGPHERSQAALNVSTGCA